MCRCIKRATALHGYCSFGFGGATFRVTTDESVQAENNLEDKIELAFRRIGEGVLPPREREVVELTLRGHPADAVGKLFSISSSTVRIHRKNIYSKLRINPQGELFSALLTAITNNQIPPKLQ